MTHNNHLSSLSLYKCNFILQINLNMVDSFRDGSPLSALFVKPRYYQKRIWKLEVNLKRFHIILSFFLVRTQTIKVRNNSKVKGRL